LTSNRSSNVRAAVFFGIEITVRRCVDTGRSTNRCYLGEWGSLTNHIQLVTSAGVGDVAATMTAHLVDCPVRLVVDGRVDGFESCEDATAATNPGPNWRRVSRASSISSAT